MLSWRPIFQSCIIFFYFLFFQKIQSKGVFNVNSYKWYNFKFDFFLKEHMAMWSNWGILTCLWHFGLFVSIFGFFSSKNAIDGVFKCKYIQGSKILFFIFKSEKKIAMWWNWGILIYLWHFQPFLELQCLVFLFSYKKT